MLPLTGLAVRVKRSYGSVGERMSNSHGSWVQHYSASTFWAFPLHAGNDSNIAIMHCIFLAYAMLTCGIEASLFHAHVDVVSRPLVRFINEYSRDRLLIAYPHRWGFTLAGSRLVLEELLFSHSVRDPISGTHFLCRALVSFLYYMRVRTRCPSYAKDALRSSAEAKCLHPMPQFNYMWGRYWDHPPWKLFFLSQCERRWKIDLGWLLSVVAEPYNTLSHIKIANFHKHPRTTSWLWTPGQPVWEC